LPVEIGRRIRFKGARAAPHRIQKQRRGGRFLRGAIFSPVPLRPAALNDIRVDVVNPAIGAVAGEQQMIGIGRVVDRKILRGRRAAVIHDVGIVE
jgi:hypothetical protein